MVHCLLQADKKRHKTRKNAYTNRQIAVDRVEHMHTHPTNHPFDNTKSVFLTSSCFPLQLTTGKCFSIHCYRFHFRFILSSPQTLISFHPQCVSVHGHFCVHALLPHRKAVFFFFLLQVKKPRKISFNTQKRREFFNLCTSVLLRRLLTANAHPNEKIHSEIFGFLVNNFFVFFFSYNIVIWIYGYVNDRSQKTATFQNNPKFISRISFGSKVTPNNTSPAKRSADSSVKFKRLICLCVLCFL